MLCISKDGGSYFVKTSRGFDDVELPLSVADEGSIIAFFEDYKAVQTYLANVYALGKQRAYGAIESLEVPECLRTIVEAPEEVKDAATPKQQDSEVRSSGTLHVPRTPVE